ncbi:CRISPR-associated helicase Cas3' [Bacteroidetes/Chlorobi group bacterium Naka2016]|nr:MAG: CRISPR-associated helicase Cas3' [Bacteroidetes/Chlorobi group bacterium Naka2016]
MNTDIELQFKNIFGFNPHDFQTKVFKTVTEGNFPILIKAPTGSGKTEAVLAPFLSQFMDNDFRIAPRMIYVLPMRVLVNSIAKRIENYAKKISPNIIVEIQHGDLPNAPFFMADIVITTLDQFVYAFARASRQVGYHIDVPAGAIASSLVVFDEAHMYRDGFTFSVMRALMEILYKSKIPFVVMTATMPESLEGSLFEYMELSAEQKIKGANVVNSNLKITLHHEPLYSNNEVNISNELLEEIRNKKTLIVLNQVKRAQRVYEEIKNRLDLNEKEIVLLHSRFTRADRTKYEGTALSLIPHKKDEKLITRDGTGIVVSTQVLEAGIDFSAELLLTEIAPADALVQRAGRCARYEGERGEMIIFPIEEDRGHLPYENQHLVKALEWLQNNNNFNIKNFDEVCSFVNNTLDYRANDFEAADTLIDLYECVLYADVEPENIQVRKDKSAKVIVVEPKIGKRRNESKEIQLENRIKEILENGKIGDYTFEADIKVLWRLFKEGRIRYELQWISDSQRKNRGSIFEIIDLRKSDREATEEDTRISPFKTYILESSNYSSEIGVKRDEAEFI